jgi:hypothetical protein
LGFWIYLLMDSRRTQGNVQLQVTSSIVFKPWARSLEDAAPCLGVTTDLVLSLYQMIRGTWSTAHLCVLLSAPAVGLEASWAFRQ